MGGAINVLNRAAIGTVAIESPNPISKGCSSLKTLFKNKERNKRKVKDGGKKKSKEKELVYLYNQVPRLPWQDC